MSLLEQIDALISFVSIANESNRKFESHHEEVDLTSALPQRKKRKRRGKSGQDEHKQPDIKRPAREQKYEYLDHTADVQLHSWGRNLAEAFEMAGIAMFGYMTELDSVDYRKSLEIVAKGHDVNSLLFHFLDELLVAFSIEEYLLFKDIAITDMDLDQWTITAVGYGECMDLDRHPQGTEVKAITYSAMQIKQTKDKCECLVVIDI